MTDGFLSHLLQFGLVVLIGYGVVVLVLGILALLIIIAAFRSMGNDD